MGIKSISIKWPLNVYMYTNGLYQLKNSDWEVSDLTCFDIKNWKSAACIVAREHYVEEQRTYPITNFYHLLKIIQAEKQNIAPFESETFWAITQFKPGQWQVTYWSIQKHVVDILRKQFKVLLPESYLLARSFSDDGVYDIGEKRGLFLHKKDNTFVCMIKDSLINSVDRFCSLLDSSDQNNSVITVSDSDYQQHLAEQFRKIPPYLLVGLWISSTKKAASFNAEIWKKPLIIGGAVLLIYTASVTSYLQSKEATLDAQLGEKRKDMSLLLKTETELRQLVEKQEAYQLLGNQYPSISNLIALIVPIREQGAQLQQIQLNGYSAVIRGSADSATKVFSELDANPLITNVDFDSSIRKDKVTSKEIFVISFEFKRGALSE